jgi:uncharacterized protein (DUF2141 family)
MNRNSIVITACSLILAISAIAQQHGTLIITATEFENENGRAVVNLFREQDDLPKKPFMTIKSEIKTGGATFVFQDLPAGSYAAIVYHDENDNGTLDHRLGLPSEAMGFSNNWKLSLFSGTPTFKKLSFDHLGLGTNISITIK